jgi:hypothetical protein
MRNSRRLALGSAALILVPLFASSCATVPASRVRTVREADRTRVGPLQECGYVGRVETAATGDTDSALERLREQAGRRGANTVVVSSSATLLRGRAFLCPASRDGSLTDGGRGSYGPDVPSVKGFNKGAWDNPADARR